MEANKVARVFVYNGMQLPDPDGSLSPAKVKDFYAGMYPELVTAEVSSGVENGNSLEFKFIKATGTKGRASKAQPVEADRPFVERLQAAAKNQQVNSKKASQKRMSAELFKALSQKGQALQMPSSAVPMFL